jgi:nicotinate-nucleotide--dimethylbenzimidazole phosphoribosyltransferase
MRVFRIKQVSISLKDALQEKINNKTKPLGALGVVEELALQIGLIQQTLTPVLSNPHVVVFAGDHGIVEEGVSAYPQEVTWQMVMNFVRGGAAINVFCKQHGIVLQVVDAGVNYNFPDGLNGLVQQKIRLGTRNFFKEPAMSVEEVKRCIDEGANVVDNSYAKGCTVIGFGEMGIGNTASASMLMSLVCALPVAQCTGRGTGLDDTALAHKIKVLENALTNHILPETPIEMLATYGGFEIAQLVGAMLRAAELGMIVLIDGFITTAAYLVAQRIAPLLKEYCIFCHQSKEKGHQQMLQFIGVSPLLDLNMRLGEGTGVAIAYPLLQSAVMFLNTMASFESAGVTNKS